MGMGGGSFLGILIKVSSGSRSRKSRLTALGIHCAAVARSGYFACGLKPRNFSFSWNIS
jgi:hypothetical protein